MKPNMVVIDDDVMFLRRLEKELKDECIIRTFSSAQEALDFLTEAPDVSVVFIDLAMEDCAGTYWRLGGLHVLQQIRKKLGEKSPRLCVLTGMDQAVHIYTCLKNGADDFVQKSHEVAQTARQIVQAA